MPFRTNVSRVVNSQDAVMIAGIPRLRAGKMRQPCARNDRKPKASPTKGWATVVPQRYALFALVGGGAAALAVATSDVNAAASLTAMSARTLRSSETPAAFNPWINWP